MTVALHCANAVATAEAADNMHRRNAAWADIEKDAHVVDRREQVAVEEGATDVVFRPPPETVVCNHSNSIQCMNVLAVFYSMTFLLVLQGQPGKSNES